jgi:uncharacterized protein (TIGR02301 family)
MRFAALALALALPGAAFAQKAAPTPTPTASPSPAAEQPPPPYDKDMLRLAEVMGALTVLRDLCGPGDGASFRAKFATLMDVEGLSAERRGEWAGAFNKGVDDYKLTYRVCTDNAKASIRDFLAEANRIAVDVGDRFGR